MSRRSRAAWSVIDQGVSAASNLALTVFVARSADPETFGGFALALAVVRLVISSNRAIAGEPLIVRLSGVSNDDWRRGVRAGLGLSAGLGAVAASASVICALFLPTSVQIPLLAGAIGLPLVLLQDTWRYGTVAAGRPRRVAAGDVVWLVSLLPLYVLLEMFGESSVFWLFLGWGLAAGASFVCWAIADGLAPTIRAGFRWFRSERALSLRFGIEYLMLQGALQAGIVLVGVLAGLQEAGAIRGAETLFGPAMVVVLGLRMFGMHAGAADHRAGRTDLLRTMVSVSLLGSGLVIVVGAIAMVMPDEAGRAILGDTWDAAQPLIPHFGAAMACVAMASGAYTGLRSIARAAESLRARTVESPLVISLLVLGSVVGGARGAAVGLAVAYVAGATAAWHALVGSVQAGSAARSSRK